MNAKKVTIVIPSYNRKGLLNKCLCSIRNQDHINKEIIIIDDGSTDNTLSYIQELYPEVTIIRNSIPLGPAYAKNQGIQYSNGKYIYFLDSDSELIFHNTISNMIYIMENNNKVGSIGGIAELDEKGVVNKIYGKNMTFDGRSYAISVVDKADNPLNEKLIECDYIETCNCFTRRDILFKIGGFDPYYIYMGEDKEFGLKVRQLGYRNYFGFKVACLHKYDETVKFDRRFMYIKSKMRFALKNNGLYYLFIIPILDYSLFFMYYPICFVIKKIFSRFSIVQLAGHKANPNLKSPGIKWVFFSVYYFLKAYLLNIQELPQMLCSRGINFLSDKNMRKFKIQKLLKYDY